MKVILENPSALKEVPRNVLGVLFYGLAIIGELKIFNIGLTVLALIVYFEGFVKLGLGVLIFVLIGQVVNFYARRMGNNKFTRWLAI